MTDTTRALAPVHRREQLAALLAIAGSAAAVGLVAWGGLGRNLVYSWAPSQLRAAGEKAVGATVRLGGLVAAGSVEPTANGVSFVLGDGKAQIRVRHHGVPPQMFREGIAVVVQGQLGRDGVFDGTRLLVSHGNEYRAGAPPGPRERRR